MSRTLMVVLTLMLVLVGSLLGCSKSSLPVYAPVYPSSPQAAEPVPMPNPVFIDSEASSTAELEAKIRQLEAENQALKDELAEITGTLEGVQSQIPNLLIMTTQVQDDSGQLATFLRGLPPLPPPPPGLDISNINNAVFKLVDIREKLLKLPPPPPLAPSWWRDLDELKDYIIDMTEWMENLKELPDFLNIAGDLEELRAQEISHLENINGIMTNIKSVLERIGRTK